MKTRYLIILFLVIGSVTITSTLYATKLSSYSLEIHGMKNTYSVGEEYSFYYTLSGYGNTCGTWLVWYPDQNGETITQGEIIDCYRPTNQELSYDSRKDMRLFSSLVPEIPGIYNVTVSVDKVKEPAVFEFEILDDFDATYGGPGNRHPAFLGYEISDSCTDDMVKYLVRYTNIFTNDEHLVWSQAGLPDHVDKKQFDVCFEEQQKIQYSHVELDLTENAIECEYGFRAIDGVCKQMGKIREKDISTFFMIQLMEFDFEWELSNRTWINPDFEIEPPARICSHIIINNGTELYLSTIWQDEYSVSDMYIDIEMPNDCVKTLPVTEIAKNEN